MSRRFPITIYNATRRAYDALRGGPRSFRETEESLFAAAREATGLDDFGDGKFREGLRVLLDAYDVESDLTPFGRMLVTREVTGILASRLRVEEAWRKQPALLEDEIRSPIFIIGLPRTGTTALHFLLGQDPDNQVLEFWLAASPAPRPPRDQWERIPHYKSAESGLRTLYGLDPSLKAIHLMTADGPEECRHLLQQSFLDDTFDSNATVPSYTSWFARQDMSSAYARHRDILKLIGSPTPKRRWVLKYPAHIRNLEVVLETYPDACFIQTHRDPCQVLPSLCSLVSGWRSLYEGRIDLHAIGQWQLDMWASLMEASIEKRRAADPSRFFDLHFRELVGDPVGAIQRIYDRFGLEFSEEAQRRLRAWHAENPQGKHGGHEYRAEDFGLSVGEMAERFAPYLDHYGVERGS